MKLKINGNLFSLNNRDINKINLLIKENFIASENISSFVLNLFDKFNASSFAEVVRKACFFNIIDKNIDENYLNDVNTFARSQIKKRMLIRRFFIKLAVSLPDFFKIFCYEWHYFDDNKDISGDIIDDYYSKISDSEIITNIVPEVINKFLSKYNIGIYEFDLLFRSVFPAEEYYITSANKITECTSSFFIKYLFIVRNLIDDNFPVTFTRYPSNSEIHFIKYLLYKGDEIDYMIDYNMDYKKIENLKSKIKQNFKVNDFESVLQKVYIEKNMRKINFAYLDNVANVHCSNLIDSLFCLIDDNDEENNKFINKLIDSINFYIVSSINDIDEQYKKFFEALDIMAESVDISRSNIKFIFKFDSIRAHIDYLINIADKISKINEFVSFKFKNY